MSRLLIPNPISRDNWLNWFRLGLATLVIVSHCYLLAHRLDDEPLLKITGGQRDLGAMAVDGFFLISGFLITKSWLSGQGMAHYFRSRVLRIYPGFVVAMILSLIMAALRAPSSDQFLRHLDWRGFLSSLPTLGFFNGVADETGRYMNSSLWTIRPEFVAYICVAGYGLFGLFKHRYLWLVGTVGVLLVYLLKVVRDGDADSWWRVGTFFAVGVTIYLYRDLIPRLRWLFWAGVVAMVLGFFVKPMFNLLTPMCGSYCLFYIAFLPMRKRGSWTNRADISYGTYLYGWPVQLLAVHYLQIEQPIDLFLASMPGVIVLALLSWFLVENRLLALKTQKFNDRDPAFRASRTETMGDWTDNRNKLLP
jgi:peptidoglycan/LPS O-acetylase OafA/YrhL